MTSTQPLNYDSDSDAEELALSREFGEAEEAPTRRSNKENELIDGAEQMEKVSRCVAACRCSSLLVAALP